ncbi:MAG: hypothetical protein HQL15_07450 [Candidatus Omnitrophica bacterium]|nr:hypothetical protein [Candidatus Omnitrophota bacterium]
MNSDQEHYIQWQKKEEERWEALCGRCGACCGAFDKDPCVHLSRDELKKYYCTIYENCFGIKKTVNGNDIVCGSIRTILHSHWPGDDCCGYKKALKEKN